ncbi:Uncharacterised protein [Salmonella enterica subsp. diarizonae]|uniref:Uncharacterized protein n=1 Tax=Salmonella diarizonae TaxID=59204 RepID=A0A379U415_SALDZ|nr:Uncharacterised protein [Salmonella enterica subsp. diarizonae]
MPYRSPNAMKSLTEKIFFIAGMRRVTGDRRHYQYRLSALYQSISYSVTISLQHGNDNKDENNYQPLLKGEIRRANVIDKRRSVDKDALSQRRKRVRGGISQERNPAEVMSSLNNIPTPASRSTLAHHIATIHTTRRDHFFTLTISDIPLHVALFHGRRSSSRRYKPE